MSLLKGADISHHNGGCAVEKIIELDNEIDFFIVKATEGRTYTDPLFEVNCRDVIENGRLLGMYHFARPDNGNMPKQEAVNFVSKFKDYIGQAIPVLDWEGKALEYSDSWALDWMQNVFAMTGVKPMLYTSQSEVHKMERLKDFDCGLWVARYNKQQELGSVSPWKTWAMWQYDDGRFVKGKYDKDYFNGTKTQFMAYCKSCLLPENITEPCHCGCDYCCNEDDTEK